MELALARGGFNHRDLNIRQAGAYAGHQAGGEVPHGWPSSPRFTVQEECRLKQMTALRVGLLARDQHPHAHQGQPRHESFLLLLRNRKKLSEIRPSPSSRKRVLHSSDFSTFTRASSGR
ncbi:MAG: hypothetical protein ACLSVD_13835 [Eggerthellaceae bacterium]